MRVGDAGGRDAASLSTLAEAAADDNRERRARSRPVAVLDHISSRRRASRRRGALGRLPGSALHRIMTVR